MINSYSDKALLKKTKELVSHERLTLNEILKHLQEIQRRRLYADLGYSSLFKYLTKELKYSEGAAVRRISALKLVKKVPKVQRMIATGEMNLSVICETQRFTKNHTSEQTEKIINEVKNKSKDQAKKKLFELMPSFKDEGKGEITKRVSESKIRISITLEEKTLKKLERLKAIKNLSSELAINYALDKVINDYEKSLTTTRKSKGCTGRRITAAVKKRVVIRAKQTCEFPACTEKRNLEFEHSIPYAKGGDGAQENIKLYCKVHNQRAAIIQFGQVRMDRYFNR